MAASCDAWTASHAARLTGRGGANATPAMLGMPATDCAICRYNVCRIYFTTDTLVLLKHDASTPLMCIVLGTTLTVNIRFCTVSCFQQLPQFFWWHLTDAIQDSKHDPGSFAQKTDICLLSYLQHVTDYRNYAATEFTSTWLSAVKRLKLHS